MKKMKPLKTKIPKTAGILSPWKGHPRHSTQLPRLPSPHRRERQSGTRSEVVQLGITERTPTLASRDRNTETPPSSPRGSQRDLKLKVGDSVRHLHWIAKSCGEQAIGKISLLIKKGALSNFNSADMAKEDNGKEKYIQNGIKCRPIKHLDLPQSSGNQRRNQPTDKAGHTVEKSEKKKRTQVYDDIAAMAAAAAAAGAAGGRGSGPGRRRHLVPGAGGEAGEGAPGGAGDYGNGLESEELEPEELLLEPEPEPEPEEEPPRPRAPPGAPGPGPGSGAPGSQEEEEEPGLVEGDPGDGAIEDPELEAIKARVREMEEEAEKLKELQNEVEKQMNMSPPPGNAGPVIMSIEEKMEADARSIYVGNVDYGATAEELEAHFHGCGSVNRVTILCDKFSGHPKGFAYIEFSDKESVRTSLALDESLFRGRQIKVIPKRTNRPGISTTDRGFPRARYRARTTNYNSSRSRFYSGFNSRPRGRVYRGRARATSWYSPY
ncbi:polyadenylate-binding protein 2-like [Neofelis nebulosa]|nr:polyadenylate-binding protein 2-like [Neofelis nebulosa]